MTQPQAAEKAGYYPGPGTVAYRCMCHIEGLPKGAEIATAVLAAAVYSDSPTVISCMEAPLREQLVFRRQKDAHPRSPWFWSLVDHTKAGSTPAVSINKDYGAPRAICGDLPVPQVLPKAFLTQLSKRGRKGVAAARRASMPEAKPEVGSVDEYIAAIEKSMPPDPAPALAVASISEGSTMADGSTPKRRVVDGCNVVLDMLGNLAVEGVDGTIIVFSRDHGNLVRRLFAGVGG